MSVCGWVVQPCVSVCVSMCECVWMGGTAAGRVKPVSAHAPSGGTVRHALPAHYTAHLDHCCVIHAVSIKAGDPFMRLRCACVLNHCIHVPIRKVTQMQTYR